MIKEIKIKAIKEKRIIKSCTIKIKTNILKNYQSINCIFYIKSLPKDSWVNYQHHHSSKHMC